MIAITIRQLRIIHACRVSAASSLWVKFAEYLEAIRAIAPLGSEHASNSRYL